MWVKYIVANVINPHAWICGKFVYISKQLIKTHMPLQTLQIHTKKPELGKEIKRSRTTIKEGSLPGVVLKSKMRWWDCSRSGLLDDRVPLTGKAGGMCFVCLSPTMLSSWDWPIPMSLHPERNKIRTYKHSEIGHTRGILWCLYCYIFILSIVDTAIAI